MYPKEDNVNKKHKTVSPEKKANAKESIAKDPPGVDMPPETDMSPPQFG